MITNPFEAGNYTVISVVNEFVTGFFTPNAHPIQCMEGLPDGAILVGVQQDWANERWNFFFIHESFPWTLMGGEVPVTTPSYRVILEPSYEIVPAGQG